MDIAQLNIDHWAKDWLIAKGLSEEVATYLTLAIDIAILVTLCILVNYLAKRFILGWVGRYVKKSKNQYDDIFLEKKVFNSLAHLLPAGLVHYSLPIIFKDFNWSLEIAQGLVVIYILFTIASVAQKFLRAIEQIALQSKRFEGKPVSSYIQVVMIVVYITITIFVISILSGKSAGAVLTTFGAATAIILLIFRDTILGLVASIQISSNDMVRVGDWVSMEKYGADGDVSEINLTTVKVRNFDKTITTVPTYAFISDSFKNWRGMQNIGVRRIKRSISIDLNTIKFADSNMIEQFSKYERVKLYVSDRQKEIDNYNTENKIDKSELLNGRHMTNVGVFRNYALNYLIEHPKIDTDETVMVRQLQPTEKGLPLEIYCFSNDINWVNYESIQSDIFDHLLSAVSKFDLKVYQNPAGNDLKGIIKP